MEGASIFHPRQLGESSIRILQGEASIDVDTVIVFLKVVLKYIYSLFNFTIVF